MQSPSKKVGFFTHLTKQKLYIDSDFIKKEANSVARVFNENVIAYIQMGLSMSDEDIQKIRASAEELNISFERAIVDCGYVEEEDLYQGLAGYYRAPYVNIEQAYQDFNYVKYIKKFDRKSLLEYNCIPWKEENNKIKVFVSDPSNEAVITALNNTCLKHFAKEMQIVMSAPTKIAEMIRLFYLEHDNRKQSRKLKEYTEELIGELGVDEDVIEDDVIEEEEAPTAIGRYVETILMLAASNHVSDIHIKPSRHKSTVKFRMDGILKEISVLPIEKHDQLVAYIKVRSNLRTDTKRRTQDGEFHLIKKNVNLQLRVSILPSSFGESCVMRLVDKNGVSRSITDLGFLPKDLETFRRAIGKPYGMVLVTGPTGSGKTTTLYAALKATVSDKNNIITVEDPVESELEGITQVQVVHAQEGGNNQSLSFSDALRSILRHDPDTILIGEIRDRETAEIAVRSAITGHLVFSTLHTNDAVSAISRLADMGVDRFLISISLVTVLAQRLVRKPCRCVEKRPLTKEEADMFGMPEGSQVKDAGSENCSLCKGTGYVGRTTVFEVLEITEKVKRAIYQNKSDQEIKDIAVSEGYHDMKTNCKILLSKGEITIGEAKRILFGD